MTAASNPELENQRAAPNRLSQAASRALTLPLPEEKTSREQKRVRGKRATMALSGSVEIRLDARSLRRNEPPAPAPLAVSEKGRVGGCCYFLRRKNCGLVDAGA